MSRMELNWGGGVFDILFNIKTGIIELYQGGEEFHSRYGGRNYYVSRTGLSGAGWAPATPTLKKVGGYRVDVSTGSMFPWSFDQLPEFSGGWKILVPFNYHEGRIDHNYPVVLRHRDGEICLIRLDEVIMFFSGELYPLEEKEVSTSFIREVGEEVVTETFAAKVTPYYKFPTLRRVLEGLHFGEVSFRWPEGFGRESSLNFWTRLGLHQIGGVLFKIASGICRRSYDRQELENTAALQAVAPSNVVFLAPNLYLQEQGEGYDAVGLFQLDGETVDYEISVERAEGIRAIRGNFSEIQERLENGAREKVEQTRIDRRRQELWAADQSERDAKFRALCEEHAEVEVTFADSLAAGNCQPGTRDFRDRTFRDRESVQVRELVPYLGVGGVRRVLEHKLLRLAE